MKNLQKISTKIALSALFTTCMTMGTQASADIEIASHGATAVVTTVTNALQLNTNITVTSTGGLAVPGELQLMAGIDLTDVNYEATAKTLTLASGAILNLEEYLEGDGDGDFGAGTTNTSTIIDWSKLTLDVTGVDSDHTDYDTPGTDDAALLGTFLKKVTAFSDSGAIPGIGAVAPRNYTDEWILLLNDVKLTTDETADPIVTAATDRFPYYVSADVGAELDKFKANRVIAGDANILEFFRDIKDDRVENAPQTAITGGDILGDGTDMGVAFNHTAMDPGHVYEYVGPSNRGAGSDQGFMRGGALVGAENPTLLDGYTYELKAQITAAENLTLTAGSTNAHTATLNMVALGSADATIIAEEGVTVSASGGTINALTLEAGSTFTATGNTTITTLITSA